MQRKAYFGIAVSFQENSVRAFRLNNDEALDQVFYQTVVAISERSYERRLLSMLLKYGTPRPQVFEDVQSLSAALLESKCGIAYMWGKDAESLPGIKHIRLLWQGE